ncbi:hypothetical protein J437_LFUL004312 [Ladona fulva]|uniref:Uncharacterized protein n=1 Tax=Ladona fulva TaxID=123851 RepID=A0A8K0JX94_LADFU|nr:hypothetical protein J437_LFUL004312 [Ladona fulva]
MESGRIILDDSGSPLFSIDRSNENRMRSNMNRSRGNYYTPYSSPRGENNSSSPGSGQESPDFIPFGFSSPVKSANRGRGQWKRQNYGDKRFYNHGGFRGNASPYQSSRGSFSSPYRGRRGGKRNPGYGDDSADISLYYHHSMVEDPWAELEEKLSISSPKNVCVRVSEGDKSQTVDSSVSDIVSVQSSSNLSLTLGSQGEESVESGSDEVSS